MSTTPNGCSTTAPASGWMWKYAEMVLAAVFLVTVTVVFMVIGGNGELLRSIDRRAEIDIQS